MEECEALCNKVGIMVAGRLQCFGSIQHLKNKFGRGIMIETKLRDPSMEHLESILQVMGKPVILETEIPHTFRTLGNEKRYDVFIADQSQASGQAKREGRIPASLLASWWYVQEGFERLYTELGSNFTGLRVLERQDLKIRWQVNKDDFQLYQIFEKMENISTKLTIPEYSISQVSLEQVFNAFAAEDRGGAAAPPSGITISKQDVTIQPKFIDI